MIQLFSPWWEITVALCITILFLDGVIKEWAEIKRRKEYCRLTKPSSGDLSNKS